MQCENYSNSNFSVGLYRIWKTGLQRPHFGEIDRMPQTNPFRNHR